MPVAGERLLFGRFELQRHERRLLVDGQPAPLGARAFDLLVALAERAGSLVSKNDLMDLVWPDVVVEENNLQAQASALRKVLGPEILATIPGRGYRFTARVERVAGDTPATPPRAAAAMTPAPPPAAAQSATGLIGRDTDLEAVLDALAGGARLVTLVGPGGVGKTSLALAALAAARAAPGDGVRWVSLAALTEAPAVPHAVSDALGLQPSDDPVAALGAALRTRRMLLVLDNAEHLVAAVAALAQALLDAAPALQLLVTSQQPLGLRGEAVRRLEPLALPAAEGAAAARGSAAVTLFLDRVAAADRRCRRAADGSLALSDEQLAAAVEVCRQLDGLPLALEMAAARWPLLGAQGLLRSLQQRLRALSAVERDVPPRQRTLQAAMDWSHGLLDDIEKAVFRRLAVFSGGFGFELAAAVATDAQHDEWQVLDALGSLVARSLVAVDAADPPRYHLAETTRLYAVAALAAAGEDAATRRRHAQAVAALYDRVRQLPPDAPDHAAARAACAAEFDNAREAFAWALAHGDGRAVRLAVGAARFTAFDVRRAETLRWLDDCAPVLQAVEPALQARRWADLARFRLFFGAPAASAAAEHALRMFADGGDALGEFDARIVLARATTAPSPAAQANLDRAQQLLDANADWPPARRLHLLGAQALAANARRDPGAALALRQQEARLAAALGNTAHLHAAQTNVVAALLALGRHEEAAGLAAGLLGRIDAGSEPINAAYAAMPLVTALVHLGRLEEAARHAGTAWRLARRIGVPAMGDVAAWLAARQGRMRAAARLLGHAQASYAAAGQPPEPAAAARLDEVAACVEQALGELESMAERAAGARLGDADVLALIVPSDDAAAAGA